jgi:hypothetical protein
MRGQPRAHDVEARVREGQPLGDGLDELRVSNTGHSKEALCGRQHGWDRVGEHDARHFGCEGEGGVAGARADVEHPFAPSGRGEVDDQLQLAP